MMSETRPAASLVLRIPIAREEMRLPERKKALAGLQENAS